MKNVILIVIGAGFGALSRYSFGLFWDHLFPLLPMGTLITNLSGSFVMGIVMSFMLDSAAFPDSLKLLLVTGFLGSFTTFSTFAAESYFLLTKRAFFIQSLHIALHVVGAIFMVFLGVQLKRLLIHG